MSDDGSMAVAVLARRAADKALQTAAYTPADFGCTGVGDETTKLQRAFDSGENLTFTKRYFGDVLTATKPGQRIAMTGAGALTVQTRWTIDAPVIMDTPYLVDCPNRAIQMTANASGIIMRRPRFENIGRAFYDARKGGQSPSNFAFGALHFSPGMDGRIVDPIFQTIWAPQAIRFEGAGSTVQIIRAYARDTFGRVIAMATGASGNALLIDRPDLSRIGFLDDIGDGTNPTAIYCPGGEPNPDCRIIRPRISYVVENGIEGPWGLIDTPDISYCGFRDPANHPNWVQTISISGVSSYGNVRMLGGSVRNCSGRGFNALAQAPAVMADIYVGGTDFSANGENDVRISSAGTTASNVRIERVSCRSLGGLFALVPTGSEVTFADIFGAITRSGTPQAFFSAPAKGRFENLDRDHATYGPLKEASILLHKDLADGVAVAVMDITVPAEAGGYVVFLQGGISANAVPGGSVSSSAMLPFRSMFARAEKSDLTGVTSAAKTDPGISAATDPAARDVASVAITTAELSEQTVRVFATATKAGSNSNPVLKFHARAEVLGVHTSRVQLTPL